MEQEDYWTTLEYLVTRKQKETFNGHQIQVKIPTEANVNRLLGAKNGIL